MTADQDPDPVKALTDAPASEPKVAKALKAPRPPKAAAPAAAPAAKAPKAPVLGKAAQIDADARSSVLRPAPNFSAPTHKGHLKKHAALVALAEAGDLAGLQAFEINATSPSPKALIRDRVRVIIALQAQAEAA